MWRATSRNSQSTSPTTSDQAVRAGNTLPHTSACPGTRRQEHQGGLLRDGTTPNRASHSNQSHFSFPGALLQFLASCRNSQAAIYSPNPHTRTPPQCPMPSGSIRASQAGMAIYPGILASGPSQPHPSWPSSSRAFLGDFPVQTKVRESRCLVQRIMIQAPTPQRDLAAARHSNEIWAFVAVCNTHGVNPLQWLGQ